MQQPAERRERLVEQDSDWLEGPSPFSDRRDDFSASYSYKAVVTAESFKKETRISRINTNPEKTEAGPQFSNLMFEFA